jgi:hypothetical protein
MKTTIKTSVLIALFSLAGGAPAFAHISYTSRDFGTFSPGNETASSTRTGAVSSTFGWAFSTDADLGDSHRNRAFRFSLANAGQVNITVRAAGVGNPLLPAFSIYSGLAHLPPDALDHDGSSITVAYLTGIFGAPNVAQGAFNALGNWTIGNDDVYNTPGDPLSGVAVAASLKSFVYQGNAADGTSSNFGSASGIAGDGSADGFVSASFFLPAGDYTLMVGGAQMYSGGLPVGPYTSYAADVTLGVIPEPSVWATLTLSGIGLVFRRRLA